MARVDQTAALRGALVVSGIPVIVHYKAIKHLYLRVNPSTAEVSVTAPYTVRSQHIEAFVKSRLDWIIARQRKQEGSTQPTALVTGSTIPLWGQPYPVTVQQGRKTHWTYSPAAGLTLSQTDVSSIESQRVLLDAFYKEQLAHKLPALVTFWQEKMDLYANHYSIRRMKTRWGSCNPNKRRISLNIWLAERPIEQLELVLVHELVHFLELKHNDRFKSLLQYYLPDWRERDRALNTPQQIAA